MPSGDLDRGYAPSVFVVLDPSRYLPKPAGERIVGRPSEPPCGAVETRRVFGERAR